MSAHILAVATIKILINMLLFEMDLLIHVDLQAGEFRRMACPSS